MVLKFRKGCNVPFPDDVSEGYMYIPPRFVANVDADKISGVVKHFIEMHEEQQFFILELPAKFDSDMPPHRDVYYIDDCSPKEACDMFVQIADLLINDGLCSFGFGCHESNDEIMVGKYNVVTIWCKTPDLYESFFQQHGLPHVDRFITAWETFTENHYGECRRVITDGKSIYDLPEMLKDYGIYCAEQREE